MEPNLTPLPGIGFLNDYVRSLESIRMGLTSKDKLAILANRALQAAYPLNVFWYGIFGRPLIDSRTIVRGYRCKYRNAVFCCPGGNSEIQFLSYWEPEVKRIISRLAHGDVVDVGSNLGLYTVMVSQLSAEPRTVLSIEADPEHFQWLKRNIEVNQCRNVAALNVAVWSKATKLTLTRHEPGGPPLDSSISPMGRNSFHIEARPLDDIISELRLNPKFIKIDTEGAEFDVLLGAQETIRLQKPMLVFEALNSHEFRRCSSLLSDFGYTTIPLSDGNFFATPN